MRGASDEIPSVVAQGGHFFYPVCLCIEQSARGYGAFFLWYAVAYIVGAGGIERFYLGCGGGRVRHGAALVDAPQGRAPHATIHRYRDLVGHGIAALGGNLH